MSPVRDIRDHFSISNFAIFYHANPNVGETLRFFEAVLANITTTNECAS